MLTFSRQLAYAVICDLYFGATHQKHIIENAFLIQTHNMLARKTRRISPRIVSKSKPQNRAKPNSYIFTAIGLCCDLTISSCDFPISWQMAHAAIWRFHGKFDDFTVIWQFHGNWPMLWFDNFMGGGPSCNFTISWQMAHPVISRFHARWSML